MNLTVALTGMLPAIVLVSAALTAVASAVLLLLYRRAVLRSMGARAGTATAPQPLREPEPRTARRSPLEVVSATTGSPTSPPTPPAYHRATQSLGQAAWVYAAGGFAYALVLATPWMAFTEGGFLIGRFLWLVACYAWPIVLALGLLAAISRGEWLTIAGAYFALLSAIGMYGLLRSPDLTAGQLVIFWLFANGAETLLLLAFLNPRVRAVGPLVLTFMVAGVTGAFLFIDLAGRSDAFLSRYTRRYSMRVS